MQVINYLVHSLIKESKLNEMRYALECAAYEEKLKLSDLEVKKAEERSAELAYEFSRFKMEWLTHVAKAQEQAQKQAPQQQG